MSRENLEIVRRAYDAWNRGAPEAAAELLAPEIQLHLPPYLPESGTWSGRDEVVGGLTALAQSWDQLRADVHELIEAGDRVVAFVRFRGRSALTGIELRGAAVDGQLWTLRDGKVVEVQTFSGTDEALQAAGLPARRTS